jgi:WD40 repeat protein
MTTEVKLVNAIDAYWDACIRAIPFFGDLNAIAFSRRGTALAVVSNQRVTIFETATGAARFEVDQSIVVCSVAFSPDESTLVCGLEDGSISVWDVETSNLVQTFVGHEGRALSVVFSPGASGTIIVSGSGDKTVRIWDMSVGRCNYVLKDHEDWVWAVCLSATGDRIISGSWDASVKVWDVSRKSCIMVLREHTEAVTSVASSYDSSLIASGSSDGTVQVYDARTGRVLHTIPTNDPIDSVQFSTHGDKIMYASGDSATIWDLSRNVQVSTINCGSYAAFSPDGTRVASWLGSFVRIWNTESGYSNYEPVSHHSSEVLNISFAPDGSVMVSQSVQDAKIWDASSGDWLFTFDSRPYLQSIVFSPNSSFAVCWSGKFYAEAQVWNVGTRSSGRPVRLDVKGVSCRVALSPCGSRLASQSSSHIILWDLGSGKRLARLDFDSPSWWESQITFAVDGNSVFIHDDDNTITQRWHISPARQEKPPSNSKQSTSLPLVFSPVQEAPSRSVLRQRCRYEGDEWILDDDGRRILWLPPDRRGPASASKCHGKKIAVGSGGRVYLADFSNAL